MLYSDETMDGVKTFVIFCALIFLHYAISFDINIHTCKEENFELTCGYFGNDIYKPDRLLSLIRRVTFPYFATGQVTITRQMMPDTRYVTVNGPAQCDLMLLTLY